VYNGDINEFLCTALTIYTAEFTYEFEIEGRTT
jgi:hypothetical protein